MAVSINEFLKEFAENKAVLLDVRSPKEYHRAHIPEAVSFPLLTDEEREIVGITFKNEGREPAIIRGFELVGNKFTGFIKRAKELSTSKEAMMYCWRGGLRSNIMSWILSTAGFKVTLLKGGYKSFRRWSIEQLHIHRNILIVGGKTGSGKTELLNELGKSGEQVIDLEKLAHHKGSAFGSLGQPPQPTTEQFENLLAIEWSKINPDKILWLENESRLIGTCALPNSVFDQMRFATVIEIEMDRKSRKKRILNEYGCYDTKLLIEKTESVKKRMGFDKVKEAIIFLKNNDPDKWVEAMLDYYDKMYQHSNAQRDKNKIHSITLDHDIMKMNVEKVIVFSKQSLNRNFTEKIHSEKLEMDN